jgi:hypothetical protein
VGNEEHEKEEFAPLELGVEGEHTKTNSPSRNGVGMREYLPPQQLKMGPYFPHIQKSFPNRA